MPESFNTRKVTVNDIEQLQEIGRKTFSETFSISNDDVNMAKYLKESFSTEKLLSELNNEASSFYFAMHDNKVIGYIKLNTGSAQTEILGDNSIEIERIYVLNEYHGKKAGQMLYEKAFEIATQINANFIWLGVWEENPKAINFYKKNGFVEFGKHIFKLGEDEQTDIMMKKLIR